MTWLLPWGFAGQQSKVNATAGRQGKEQPAPMPPDQANMAVSRALPPGAGPDLTRAQTDIASSEAPTRASDVLLWASRSTLMSQLTETARPVVTILNPGNVAESATPRAPICRYLNSHLQRVSADSGGGCRIGNAIQQCALARWTDGRTARPIFKCPLRTTTDPPTRV